MHTSKGYAAALVLAALLIGGCEASRSGESISEGSETTPGAVSGPATAPDGMPPTNVPTPGADATAAAATEDQAEENPTAGADAEPNPTATNP
jgi:hypothetical protein